MEHMCAQSCDASCTVHSVKHARYCCAAVTACCSANKQLFAFPLHFVLPALQHSSYMLWLCSSLCVGVLLCYTAASHGYLPSLPVAMVCMLGQYCSCNRGMHACFKGAFALGTLANGKAAGQVCDLSALQSCPAISEEMCNFG